MSEEGRNWRKFHKMKLNRKNFSRRARRAEGATLRHAHKFIIKRWDNIRGIRRHIITWMLGVGLLIATVGLQMVWFQRSYLTTASSTGGVYAEAVTGPIATLNPLYASTNAELAASKLLFSSLFSYDTAGALHNDLAVKMSTDESEKIYTVTLRPDVKWSDGFDLTAKDVEFTVDLMKDPTTRSTMNASWKDISAKALNDYQVEFTLPGPYAAFPQALTFSVLPEHSLKGVDRRAIRENGFSNAPIGSGAFQLRLLQSIGGTGSRKIVHLGANENYFLGKPKLDRFQLHVFDSSDGIATALRTGEVSAAANVTNTVAQDVDEKRYDTIIKPVNSGVYAILNTTQPLLKDVNVRRALQVGTDPSIIREKLFSKPKALSLPFVDGQLTGSDVPKVPWPNSETAKDILETAGWKLGSDGMRTKDGQTLKLRVVTRKNSDFESALEILAKQWRVLGIQAEIQIVDTADASQSFTQTILQPRNYDVLIDELLIGADPDVFAYWHSRGILNFANYSSSTSDDALSSARIRSDSDLRNVKYKSFAAQWLSDAPAIGLYQSNMVYVHTKNSNAMAADEKLVSSNDRYASVIYWTANQSSVYKTP